MDVLDRQNNDSVLNSFVVKYKPSYFYLEYIIFIRRICIAMFSASSTDNNYKLVFIMVMSIFLYVQYRCQPFIIEEGNTMETKTNNIFTEQLNITYTEQMETDCKY